MKMQSASRKLMLLLMMFVMALGPLSQVGAAAGGITAGTTYVVFYLDKQEAFLNGEQVMLDAAPITQKGRTFVPAKFLGDAFGMKVQWLSATPGYNISIDTVNKSAFVNGYWFKMEDVATVINGRLMIKLTWLSDYMGATYTYNSELKKIDVLHVNKPAGIYDPESDSSSPVAKFTFIKDTYRIGEPIDYVNLSYDPDAEALKLKWEGKEDAFFKAGTYPITLTATDKSGNVSAPYTRDLVITDEVYLNTTEYPIYTGAVGSFIKSDWSTLNQNFFRLDNVSKVVQEDRSRSLLLSDSPETFTELGILYQDTVTGKTRLYANHQNGMKKKVSFAILATNTTDQPVTLTTTRKGEVYPTLYAMQMGSEASVDFLMNTPINEKMVIPPGETFIYKQFPDFYPGQGVNLLYDVETDGAVQYSFAVADKVSADMINLPKLPYDRHIRGTFPITGFDWKLDLSETGLSKPKVIVLGDGKVDLHQKGFDPMRGIEVEDPANYGTVYRMHADNPRKMAIMVLAKGGPFKGPFKVNGEIRKVPGSGVITAFDGLVILAKTTGKEESLDIEFTPPAGSAFSINLIFYPLDERAK
jgi:hypothetical protein